MITDDTVSRYHAEVDVFADPASEPIDTNPGPREAGYLES